jgi:hypothetical protein
MGGEVEGGRGSGGAGDPPEAGTSAGTDYDLYEFDDSTNAYASPYAGGDNPLVYWATLEPQDGVYNWSALDSAIARAQAAGKKIIPRIYTNLAGWGQGTPSWVFNAGAAWYYNNDLSQSGGVRQPVPTDPVFKQKFGTFPQALGARYDGNPTYDCRFVAPSAVRRDHGETIRATLALRSSE